MKRRQRKLGPIRNAPDHLLEIIMPKLTAHWTIQIYLETLAPGKAPDLLEPPYNQQSVKSHENEPYSSFTN